MKYRVKHVLEYGILRLFTGLIRFLPYPMALALACLNARLLYLLFPSRVKEAKRRIALVLGDDMTSRDVSIIAWKSWRNTVFSITELARLGTANTTWVDSLYDNNEAVETVVKHLESGGRAIVATCHTGSLELGATRLVRCGIPLFSVAGQQKNHLVDDFIARLRLASGVETLTRGSGVMRAILRKIKAGSVFAILPDVRMRTPGVVVPFLGGQANVGEGMASFARHTDAVIFPVTMLRHGWMRHEIIIHPPIHPDNSLEPKTDIQRMTAEVLAIIEQSIRSDPAQWFWYNKRWILDPIA